jgi:hypothetical protein
LYFCKNIKILYKFCKIKSSKIKAYIICNLTSRRYRFSQIKLCSLWGINFSRRNKYDRNTISHVLECGWSPLLTCRFWRYVGYGLVPFKICHFFMISNIIDCRTVAKLSRISYILFKRITIFKIWSLRKNLEIKG